MRGKRHWSRRTCSSFSSVSDQNETSCNPVWCCGIPPVSDFPRKGGTHRVPQECSAGWLQSLTLCWNGCSHERISWSPGRNWACPKLLTHISTPQQITPGMACRKGGRLPARCWGSVSNLWFQNPSLWSSHHWFKVFGWQLSHSNPFVSIWTLFLLFCFGGFFCCFGFFLFALCYPKHANFKTTGRGKPPFALWLWHKEWRW